ncbi:MAG: hypothetical protein CMJ50_09395 [Planctomycetaceae bacterium]|nr:hypothetical protein [Planctomycetaceae bacterium]
MLAPDQPCSSPLFPVGRFQQLLAIVVFGMSIVSQAGCRGPENTPIEIAGTDTNGVFHVHPGEDIQMVLDAAAEASAGATVRIHEGTYRPAQYGQAFIRFNRQHDGIKLEAVGEVVLTAANEDIADPSEAGFPAMVNHVVFFGDGISPRTVLRGVTITGANGFVSDDDSSPSIEPDSNLQQLEKGLFFYCDGGGIKIFGRSYPTIEGVVIRDNVTRLCGAGVSVEHRGFSENQAVFRDCVFRDNRCPGTGSAVDVLGGSSAVIENCLFVGNIGNTGMDRIAIEYGLRYNHKHGCGALTVFPNSRVSVRRCTFTENWNGADDKGVGNSYLDSIFWQNVAGDGSRPGGPYELDIADASNVRRCYIGGNVADLQQTIVPQDNNLDAPNPQFDMLFQPRAKEYQDVGYRLATIRSVHITKPLQQKPES